MGYRLEISELEYKGCGGKLYGYFEDETKLRSWKWLKKHKYIDGDEYWDYGYNPQIILPNEEFQEFIELYIHDLLKYYKYPIDEDWIRDLREIGDSDNYKVLEWL